MIRLLLALSVLALAACSGPDAPERPAQPTPPAPPPAPAPAPHPLSGTVPWELPPLATLQAAKRRVFAHYFSPFPVSICNQPAERDYYTNEYLTVNGERGKHAAYGGYLRQRPLPRPPRPGDARTWKRQDLEAEIRAARDAGLDGFTINILTHDDGNRWVADLLDAAHAVDPAFRIMLMPDMTAGFKGRPEAMVPLLLALGRHPAVDRLPDGRVVVAPYCAQVQPVEWWRDRLAECAAAGMPVAFVPLFHGVRMDYAPISHGFSDWGGRCPTDSRGLFTMAAQVHQHVPVWMQPVAPQDMRPKSRIFIESRGSETFRMQWDAAIQGGADWVQVITWNDYSEATEIAPSSGTGHAFYDLTAFYTAWFKTGIQPAIRHDAMLAFHRRQRTDIPLRVQAERWKNRGNDRAVDEIELVAFLTAPADLVIDTAGVAVRETRPAGIQVLRAPLTPGRPSFRILRNGEAVAAMESRWPVDAEADFQDLLYRATTSYRTE